MLKTYQRRNIRILFQLLFLILSIIFLIYRPFYFTKVIGNSMKPTLQPNSFVLANALDKRYDIGDVVLVEQNSELIIKRIAYVGGQKFAVVDLGFRKYNPLPVMQDMDYHMKYLKKYGINAFVYTVPKGHVFLIGDNDPESEDSRAFGALPIQNIKAKIIEP
jgi:signal peptidase I